VPDPSQPYRAHLLYATDLAQYMFGTVDQLGVDGIHETVKHLAGGASQDDEDGGRDHQSDDRIGSLESGRDAGGTEDHSQRGEAIGAGVKPVGHQRRRSDAATDPDPVAGNQFIAGEADESRHRYHGKVIDILGVEKAADRLVADECGGGGYGQNDRDASQVFGSAVPVRIAPSRGPPANDKRDAKRDSGQCIGDVVKGVTEQGDGSRYRHNRCLGNGGGPQGDKGERDGPHALVTRL
jgi:hypothetical protein